jgi:hypothetical protein
MQIEAIHTEIVYFKCSGVDNRGKAAQGLKLLSIGAQAAPALSRQRLCCVVASRFKSQRNRSLRDIGVPSGLHGGFTFAS